MQQLSRVTLISLTATAMLAISCTGFESPSTAIYAAPPDSAEIADSRAILPDQGTAPIVAFASLPEILELPHSARFLPADGYHDGSEFSAPLPNQRVSVSGTSAVFTPVWPPEGAGGDKLAYAIYDFTLPDYAGTPVSADIVWASQPAVGQGYLAFANFAAMRWDWQILPGSQNLTWPQFAQYIDDNERCLLALLLVGTDSATLDSIQLSTAQMPSAALLADVASGIAPLAVSFNATGSSDSDGTIADYEWDFDGNGTFNEPGAEQGAQGSSVALFTYESGTSHSVQLRVTDNDGLTDTAALPLAIRSQWLHTIGRDRDDKYQAIAVDQSDNIFAAGYTIDEDPATVSLLLTKWSSEGELKWGRTWSLPGGYSVGLDMALDETDAPVICGWYQSTPPATINYDGILMKWTPDGELAWARVYAGTGNDFFNSLCVDGTDIYIAAVTNSLGSNDDALVLRVDGTGNFVWAQRYYWFDDNLSDSALLVTPQGTAAFYAAGYQYNSATTKVSPFYLRYGLDGTFEADGIGIPGNGEFQPVSFAVDYDQDADPGMQTRLYIAMKNNEGDMLLSGLFENRSSIFTQVWSPTVSGETWPFALMLDSSSGLLMAGSSGDSAALWRLSSASGVFSAAQSWTISGQQARFHAMALLDNGILTAGYSVDNSGEWGPLAGSQNPTSIAWSSAAGLVTPVNIALDDPGDNDDVDSWPSPEMDMDTGELDGLLSLYVLP
jgi:PKD repeat protein